MTEDELHEALSEWAESDAIFDTPHGPVVRGAAAAREGRHAVMAGRPNLGQATASGKGPSPKRQVRLDSDTNAALDAYAAAHDMKAAEVIRAALHAYLGTPGPGPRDGSAAA